MTRHDDKIYLQHMLSYAREALQHAQGSTREEIESDRLLQLALLHLVEIVGEAASKVSPATQARLGRLPWRGMIGMRNRIIHGYDTAEIGVLWDTLQQDLPQLIQMLEQELPNFEERDSGE